MSVSPELKTLMDAFDEPSILIRPDYSVAYANRAFVRRYGRSDYAGRRCHELVFHRALTCAQCGQSCPLEESKVTQQDASSLQRAPTPTGFVFYNLKSTPIRRADGQAVFVMETIRERRSHRELLSIEGVVAHSNSTKGLLSRLSRVVSLNNPLLLVGKKGTGKGVFAKVVHENSRRAAQTFLHLDCSTLDESVLEEALRQDRGTRLDGGTIYLSDVAELSHAMQEVLLRLLETGAYAPRGRLDPLPLDVRVIASTQHDLALHVARGEFREDLYYRLNVCRFAIPSLSERAGDIPELAQLVLNKLVHKLGSEPRQLSPEAIRVLQQRRWPGNSYELESVLERAVIFSDNPVLGPEDVSELPSDAPVLATAPSMSLEERIASWQGTREALAKELGISVRTLYRMLKEQKI